MPGSTPTIAGIHHVKLPVADLDRSLRFYERVFAAERIPEADHRREADGSLYALILKITDLGALLELRLDREQAERQRGFDPLTLAVADRAALADWITHLDALAIPHSPILMAIQAWLVVLEDPDGHRLRLYTQETHGRDVTPDEADPWVGG